jgi:hypothetical protein
MLTEKGLAFMPSLLEVANGSAQNDPQTGAPPVWIALVKADKAKLISRICEIVQRGGSIFVGPDRVARPLGVENE